MGKKTLLFGLATSLLFLWACEKENSLITTTPDPDATEKADLRLAQTMYAEWQAEQTELTFRSGNILRAGSVDQLAALLASTPEGGTIWVEPGLHTESAGVVIDKRVRLAGGPGSRIEFTTQPLQLTGIMEAALHVKGVQGVTISGLEITAKDGLGGTGILLENAPNTRLVNNEVADFEFGVMMEKSDRAFIAYNHILATTAWQSGVIPQAHALIVMNGQHAVVFQNKIENGTFGFWPCDEHGIAVRNEFTNNFIGLILCKVPPIVVLPDGSVTGSERPAGHWRVSANLSHHNFNAGYLVIDGANHNLLSGNTAHNNGSYDYDLSGDSFRFGFLTPTSVNNIVKVADAEDTVKDCGVGNTVTGGTAIDTGADPCF